MGTLETQFPDDGLENGAKENELNNDLERRFWQWGNLSMRLRIICKSNY